MSRARGKVFLVGAGPGDPGLITVLGLAALREAEVVVFDRLINQSLLSEAPGAVEQIDVGKRPGHAPVSQEEINSLLVDRANRGLRVVRLKGGDPFVFGRGFEELSACREASIDCVVIPGVSSAIAAPAIAGIPLTLRGVSRSFAVLTAEVAPDTMPTNFSRLQGIDTLVILMGRSKLETIARTLIESGWSANTPVSCIEQATMPGQRLVCGTLETIATLAGQAELSAPMVTVVGQVACLGARSPSPGEKWRRGSALQGKRFLITRPRTASQKLARKIDRAGAVSIICPLLRIEIPNAQPALDAAIEKLSAYHWLAFTSVHGVTAFWRRLAACGFDARRLAGCKLAAIGLATARRLQKYGLKPDVIGCHATELANQMIANATGAGRRVLWPRSDHALPNFSGILRGAGLNVDDLVAYKTTPVRPADAILQSSFRHLDAVLLYSPTAATQLATLKPPLQGAMIVCVGQTTAEAARSVGLHVDAVASTPSDQGVLDALERLFTGKVTV